LLPAAKELGLNPKPRHFKPFEFFDHTGSLQIAGTKGMVEETLKITSVDKIMHFYPSLSEAAHDFQLV